MNREDKAAVIDQVAERIGESDAIFAVDYRGITVAQIKELRTKLSDQNTTLQVTKNSLAELAADKAGATALKPLLVGPTALAFVKGDAAAAAKVLSDTARTLRLLESKGGYMDGSVLSAAQVDVIAKLPSRQVLYGQLVGVVASPISGVVRGLNALIQGLAIQLGAIAEQGLVSGAAPAAEPAEPAAKVGETGNPDAPDGDTDVDTPEDAPAGPDAPEKSGQEKDIPLTFPDADAPEPAVTPPIDPAHPNEAPSDEDASTDAPSTDA
jgi:large subunit ribosomal protein L10